MALLRNPSLTTLGEGLNPQGLPKRGIKQPPARLATASPIGNAYDSAFTRRQFVNPATAQPTGLAQQTAINQQVGAQTNGATLKSVGVPELNPINGRKKPRIGAL